MIRSYNLHTFFLTLGGVKAALIYSRFFSKRDQRSRLKSDVVFTFAYVIENVRRIILVLCPPIALYCTQNK